MPLRSRTIEAALLAKGFQRHDSKHRHFVFVNSEGEPTEVRTVMSHGRNRDISGWLHSEMARQCRLSRREFDRLVDCSMSQQQYEQLLAERGHI